MRSEDEIKERLQWCKDCYNSAIKYSIYADIYKEIVSVLEWVLEDTDER